MNRAELKAYARDCMRDTHPSPYLVTLAYLALPLVFLMIYVWTFSSGFILSQMDNGALRYDVGFAPNYLAVFALIFVFSLLYFLITVGYTGYCLRISRGEDASFSNLFDYVNRPFRFIGLTLLMALVGVLPAAIGGLLGPLGSIAAVVLNFYFSLGFSQAALVAIDRPELGIVDCMRESWGLMDGRRGEYFVLQLSFFGWMLTTMFLFPVLFVTPYMQVTMAGYYNIISDWQPEQGEL